MQEYVEIPKELHDPLPQNDKTFAGFALMNELYKKGFNMICLNVFILYERYAAVADSSEINKGIFITDAAGEDGSRPRFKDCEYAATWQEILQWFREQHHIYIEIQSSAPNLKCAYTVMKYKYMEKEAAFKQVSYKTAYPKDTYEEALIDGITHAMKLI